MPITVYDLEVGVRFYANDDATTFDATTERWFEWYRDEMEYTDDLEIEPVYDFATAQPQTNEKQNFEVSITDEFSTRITAYEEALAAADAF